MSLLAMLDDISIRDTLGVINSRDSHCLTTIRIPLSKKGENIWKARGERGLCSVAAAGPVLHGRQGLPTRPLGRQRDWELYIS